MSILVIEGGQPNGTDLVMGEANGNPLHRAKEAGQPIIKVVDLGDDFAMAGIRLMPAFDETKENLCVLLVIDAGKSSRLVGLTPIPTVIAEVGRISIAELKDGITKAMNPPVTV